MVEHLDSRYFRDLAVAWHARGPDFVGGAGLRRRQETGTFGGLALRGVFELCRRGGRLGGLVIAAEGRAQPVGDSFPDVFFGEGLDQVVDEVVEQFVTELGADELLLDDAEQVVDYLVLDLGLEPGLGL